WRLKHSATKVAATGLRPPPGRGGRSARSGDFNRRRVGVAYRKGTSDGKYQAAWLSLAFGDIYPGRLSGICPTRPPRRAGGSDWRARAGTGRQGQRPDDADRRRDARPGHFSQTGRRGALRLDGSDDSRGASFLEGRG